ncbi:unnamed protein product [Prorocentrum cordatum]|nr:unnamed protein product [Polarella glacialis]
MAMTLMLTMIGQLASQVNASHCMLDFVSTYANWFTVYVALAIEFSGILHSAYLVQWIVEKMAGRQERISSKRGTALRRFIFVGRIIMSVCILGLAFAVTGAALFQRKTTMWQGVPEVVSVLMFFFLMAIVGMLEGAQIAFFAVAKLPKSDWGPNLTVVKTCELIFSDGGRNLPAFVIGRQIIVTMCFLISARITTINVDPKGGDETVFGVPNAVEVFFNTGLLGAIITTTIGSVSWQLVASVFPVAFLRNPLVYILLRMCLCLEFTGICSGAWVLASVHKRVSGFRRDECYLDHADNQREGTTTTFANAADVEVEPNVLWSKSWFRRRIKATKDVSLLSDPGVFHADSGSRPSSSPQAVSSGPCSTTIGRQPDPSPDACAGPAWSTAQAQPPMRRAVSGGREPPDGLTDAGRLGGPACVEIAQGGGSPGRRAAEQI